MPVPAASIPKELIREIRKRKWITFFLFAFVSMATLGVGLVWPTKYATTVTIFIDDNNIIRPLLGGSAVTNKVTNRISSAKEMLFSHRVLEKIADLPQIWGKKRIDTKAKQEELISTLRRVIRVKKKGAQYFSITYTNKSPAISFRITQKLGQEFISESESKKRAESRNAYSFIDKQVNVYQQQLTNSETKLKNFKSENNDGTEAESNSRMANLRTQLEQSVLKLKELYVQKSSIIAQLSGVNRVIIKDENTNPYKVRIKQLQNKRNTLRLSYHDTYPDIISLNQQINDLKKALKEQESVSSQEKPSNQVILNPNYQVLASKKNNTETQIKTTQTRISTLKGLLYQENLRMERILANKATFSELTRDYVVNKGIYNKLLKRRETARITMHLDIEGQGLSYKIYEPPEYPLVPVGLRFRYFALVGLFLGLLTPVGLYLALLQFDNKVRSGRLLYEYTGIPVLAEIPVFSTPIELRRRRFQTLIIFILSLGVVAFYAYIVWLRIKGVL